MEVIQDDCITIANYAKLIGKSRRTVQRYISKGLPVMRGTHQCIHLPSANTWWLAQIDSIHRLAGENNA